MSMVQVRIVRMLVPQRCVLVPMRMWLSDRTFVIMLVMLIVTMSVFMS